ncbi:MAG: NAD-dependent epimerase/dehydratase family protein [Bacteroides thetaiotaomicron]
MNRWKYGGDGSAIRDYIYIEDLANVFYQLINKDVYNETINLGSGRGFSVNDVLAFFENYFKGRL